jgi:PilZ domain
MRPVSMNVATKNTVETGADRRAFGRRDTNMAGVVRLSNHVTHACVIRDISEGGALLEFPAPVNLSGRLRLSFDGAGQEIICEARHARGNRIGVQFVRNITLAARPLAAPTDATAPLPVLRRAETPSETGRGTAASELVALRRNAGKASAVKPDAIAAPELVPIVVEIPVAVPVAVPAAVEASAPRDMSSLLESVATLAAVRAVPRPLPARAFATALVIEPPEVIDLPEVPEVVLPRDMSSLLQSVAMLSMARAVPRPLPARAYAQIAA